MGTKAIPKIRLTDKISNIFHIIIAACCLFLMAALSIVSLFQTVDLNLKNSYLENIVFNKDNFFINILILILCLVFFLFIHKLVEKIPEKMMKITPIILGGWVLTAGIIWVQCVQSSPTQDSLIVTQAAYDFSKGNYSVLASAQSYFNCFPFQLGYVFYSEIFIRLFNLSTNFIALEEMNVACLAIAYMAILGIVKSVFKNKTVYIFTAILLAACLQPILFSTFLYGNIPGLMFGLLAVFTTLKYFNAQKQSKKIIFAVLSSLFIGLSIMIKLNNMIILVAICILIVFYILKTRKIFNNLIYLAVLIIVGTQLSSVIIWQYEARSHYELKAGIPMVSWMAMGLNESETASGWYNGTYTVTNYSNANYDNEIASNQSKQEIKKRESVFLNDINYSVNFFFKKFASQWNEPTYGSIWTNEVRDHYSEPVSIGKYIAGSGNPDTRINTYVPGLGESGMKTYMNFFQQFIVFGAMIAILIILMCKKDLAFLVFPLIILGGFAYHLLFEAKSQYAITYFILMIPLAAYGIYEAELKIKYWILKLMGKETKTNLEAENQNKSDKKKTKGNKKQAKIIA